MHKLQVLKKKDKEGKKGKLGYPATHNYQQGCYL